MPDQSFLRALFLAICIQNTLNNSLAAQILLITAHHFHLPARRCSRKNAIITIYIQQYARPDQTRYIPFDCLNGAMRTTFVFKPRSPLINGCTDTGIVQLLSLGSKSQYIGHEHFRNALFIMQHIDCSVRPCYLRSNRRFYFANTNRDSIDKINQVQTFSPIYGTSGKFPLISHHTIIIYRFFTEESYGNILAILPERFRIFIEQQRTKTVIGSYQFLILPPASNRCTKFIDYLLGLLMRYRIQPDKSIQKPRFHKNGIGTTRYILRLYILPSALGSCFYEHLLHCIVFGKHICRILLFFNNRRFS